MDTTTPVRNNSASTSVNGTASPSARDSITLATRKETIRLIQQFDTASRNLAVAKDEQEQAFMDIARGAASLSYTLGATPEGKIDEQIGEGKCYDGIYALVIMLAMLTTGVPIEAIDVLALMGFERGMTETLASTIANMVKANVISQQPEGSGWYYLTQRRLDLMGYEPEPNPHWDLRKLDRFRRMIKGLLDNFPVPPVDEPDLGESDSELASNDGQIS